MSRSYKNRRKAQRGHPNREQLVTPRSKAARHVLLRKRSRR